MPRSPVVTRPARVSDLPLLCALWGELKTIGGRAERAVNPIAVPDLAENLRRCLADPACRLLLATVNGEPAGMALLWATRPDPMSDSRVVRLTHVIVVGGKRRRGVGHSLVAAAADFAEELGVEHLTTGVYPSLRDASRFYARLGFAPMLVQRVAPVGVVRRRLAAETSATRLDGVVRRRTRLRRTDLTQRLVAHAGEPIDQP